jgi:anaerobic magnesium-protoporphyrin IX monomethyl ester cyclase
MDLLLISPPLSPNERYARNVGNTGGHLPPLGLASIAAYLRQNEFSVGLIDALALDMDNAKILDYIEKSKPKVVGISSITSVYHRAIGLANEIKKRFPEILLIIGGHHATNSHKEIHSDNIFDITVIGEGEITALELMKAYQSTGYSKPAFLSNYNLLRTIKGISFLNALNANSVELTEPRPLITNLDMLPFPARDLLPMDKYIPLPNQYKHLPIAHMVVIRGCPFSCHFCSCNSVFGRKIRAKSPPKVIEEIKLLIEKYHVRDISFWDDMMTVNKSWMDEFCGLLISEKLGITWTCYSRVDTVTKEMLQNMKDAGCWNIFFGFESGNQDLLNLIGKGITLKQIEDANRWCHEVGIEVRASFMLALPGETPEKARTTIEFAKRLNPEYAQFCITTPYPGTKLYYDAKNYGRLDDNYSRYNIWEPVFVPFGYQSEEEIKSMERKAVREFYFRPSFILNHLKHIRNFEDMFRYIKGARFLLGFS